MKKEKIDYKKEKRLKKRLEKEADHLWHLVVIKKYGDNCFFNDNFKKARQHQNKTTKSHHYFPKGKYPTLRYEIDNGVPVCWPCHFKAEKFDRSMLADILVSRGKYWYNKLTKLILERSSWSSFQNVEYYQNIIKKLKQYVESSVE